MACIPITEGRSVAGILYRDSVLSVDVSHYTAARPRTGVRGIQLLYDNVKSYLCDNSIDTLSAIKIIIAILLLHAIFG